MHTTLISAAELQQLLHSSTPVQVYDCSADLMNPQAGYAQYQTGHIPGAVFASLDEHLSQHADQPSAGRHPLPTRERFATWLGSTGLHSPQTQVVVYDRQNANFCGRLWWMLKWCGHEAVAVLDGGWAAWQAAGGAQATGPSPVPSSTRSYPLAEPLVRMTDTAALAQNLGKPSCTVLDARAAARFRGEMEPLDPVAGHIPGALNRPFSANMAPDGRFKSPDVLRAEFEQLLAGRDPASVVHQCGSGVSAVPNLLAMEVAGMGRSTLYPGSWSAWCNTPGLPCAQG
ncbi:MAG: hypothetical protein RLZZ352_1344 [Pseudomonadota bacterium]|jgi:thiosulfate/3-mercaptopyruvate sulfurtransferase